MITAIVGRNASGKTQYVEQMRRNIASDTLRYVAFRDSYGSIADGAYYLQQRWNQHDIDPETPMVNGQPLISLSSGELRRYQLRKALASHPKTLILDNPFIGLDAETRQQLRTHLLHIANEESLDLYLVIAKTDDLPDYVEQVIDMDNDGKTMTLKEYLARFGKVAHLICRTVENARREEQQIRVGRELPRTASRRKRTIVIDCVPQIPKVRDNFVQGLGVNGSAFRVTIYVVSVETKGCSNSKTGEMLCRGVVVGAVLPRREDHLVARRGAELYLCLDAIGAERLVARIDKHVAVVGRRLHEVQQDAAVNYGALVLLRGGHDRAPAGKGASRQRVPVQIKRHAVRHAHRVVHGICRQHHVLHHAERFSICIGRP